MANSAYPDQLASSEPTDLELHCLQKQGISGFTRTRVNNSGEAASPESGSITLTIPYYNRNAFAVQSSSR